MRLFRSILVASLVLALIGFLGLQIWATRALVDASRSSSQAMQRQLAGLDPTRLTQAKTEEEIIALRVENERKAVFISTFVANINAALAVLVTLIGSL